MAEHANTFLLVTILLFVTIVLISAMKYFSAARQARSRITGEDAYRELAKRATAAQFEAAATLASVQAELAEIRTRLASVEKILKEVE
jgi:Tfp pilus assembly protein PilO